MPPPFTPGIYHIGENLLILFSANRIRFSLIPDDTPYRELFERLDTGFVQVTRLVRMPLLFVRRFTDIEGGAFPRPVLDKIILLPVVEDGRGIRIPAFCGLSRLPPVNRL